MNVIARSLLLALLCGPGTTPAAQEEWSWRQPQADVIPNGDLKWKPRPFAYQKGDSVRYIDFEGGDDAHEGTSKEKPWKHHPWDAAATGKAKACSGIHTYVFKGGVENQEMPRSGERFLGGAFGGSPIPGTGIFAALDMKTNRLVWRQAWKDSCYSGSMATAGGLVFVGRNDGRLTALDSSSGKRLWEFQTGAGMNSPPIAFEYEGVQYLAAYSAGNLFAGSPRGDSLWLFSLKGTLGPAPAASAAPAGR